MHRTVTLDTRQYECSGGGSKMNQYCDECAELLAIAFYPIANLKVDISSANAGESATICPNCYEARAMKEGNS